MVHNLIHRLILYNKSDLEAITLYDDGEIKLNDELLVRLIQAMTLLSQNLGHAKGGLKEVELGNYQIGIVTNDPLSYVILQDKHDNEPFTRRILELIIEQLHDMFMTLNFKDEVPAQMMRSLLKLLKTMKFPDALLPEVSQYIDQFQIRTRNMCDTVVMCDLDDGIVEIFQKPEMEGIITLLMEILSEMPLEKSWVGEMIRENGKKEMWFLQKVGMTDFTMIGRAVCEDPIVQQNLLTESLEILTNQIHELILSTPDALY